MGQARPHTLYQIMPLSSHPGQNPQGLLGQTLPKNPGRRQPQQHSSISSIQAQPWQHAPQLQTVMYSCRVYTIEARCAACVGSCAAGGQGAVTALPHQQLVQR